MVPRPVVGHRGGGRSSVALDQPAVPGQQRRRGHDPMDTDSAGQKAGQRGQDRPARPGQPRPAPNLPAQHRHLMTQGQQLREHDLVAPNRAQQRVEHANRNQIEQLEHHDHDGASN
jgi:hypothetical protein